MKRHTLFLNMYSAMLDALGPSGWWPAKTPFEMAVGAILTQNTNWQGAARAMDNIRLSGRLDPVALYELPDGELAELLRPAGYFRLKAGRLKNLLALIVEDLGGDILTLADAGLETARERLLAVKGVGPETADSILLYGLGLPSFVVDAYTARICSRHALVPEDASYDELRELFMDALPVDVGLYNEFHALLVRVGNGWCRPRAPKCDACPLGRFLP
ncbi:endonuclease III domain-containing protein [Desulfovibrio sp. TomC]|uniref:endonuclease III domain-containing protein n=1 Tax=Desulfovibrio sp. TomC TaxID=1562888 RepID=UPI00057557F6|nr:endonuclease [Desulfovibrio sp. TomC]KHK01232.1 Endonuclease III [Desulfovibrio sp. TomC]